MELMTAYSTIAADTREGLSSQPKYLLPKYFYDNTGSHIFQDIMNMPEYYLTRCETEIFENTKQAISDKFISDGSEFELIELGSGDGTKTQLLLKQLLYRKADFRFIPIDISAGANENLIEYLGKEIPDLTVEAQTGDYFEIMHDLNSRLEQRKVVLFLGSNIGNFSDEESDSFLSRLYYLTRPGDMILIGFDLKKSPGVIMNAYNDIHGHTRRFNLNLLERLNKELGADFDLNTFEHHTTYDPVSGDVRSFLVSTIEQTVMIQSLDHIFHFYQWEPIFMERSRKFDIPEIEDLANRNGFQIEQHFVDSRKYFVDTLMIRK